MDPFFSGNLTENDWIENIIQDLETTRSPIGPKTRKSFNATALCSIRQETGIHFSATNNKYIDVDWKA